MIIHGTIISKEANLTASFEGREQPYVLCVVARLEHPDVQSEVRIIGQPDIPQGVGDVVHLEVVRTITDRHAGVVRFDAHLVAG
jgi:hypothetical protein